MVWFCVCYNIFYIYIRHLLSKFQAMSKSIRCTINSLFLVFVFFLNWYIDAIVNIFFFFRSDNWIWMCDLSVCLLGRVTVIGPMSETNTHAREELQNKCQEPTAHVQLRKLKFLHSSIRITKKLNESRITVPICIYILGVTIYIFYTHNFPCIFFTYINKYI